MKLPFLARNSKKIEKEYKLTVVGKTLVSNIPKIRAIPYLIEGVIV